MAEFTGFYAEWQTWQIITLWTVAFFIPLLIIAGLAFNTWRLVKRDRELDEQD